MKKTITLCMIVKNESHIILECLNTIYKYLDYWVVCDTGSTDGTQDIIRNFFKEKGIPGEIVQHEWKGFGHNRTEAFRACEGKADYAFVIDADDYVDGTMPFDKENMDADVYALRMGRPDFSWWRNQVFNLNAGKWEYVGVLHEYARCDKQNLVAKQLIGNYRVVARTMGARNLNTTPIEKYKKDAETLEKALLEEPDNQRYHFYLAQSYFDSQQWAKAEEQYARRASMGGWQEEAYYSIYRIALCKAMQEKPWPEVQQAFLDAYNYRPCRAEPLYHIAQVYRQKFNMPVLAFMFARAAADIPFPSQDILFVADAIYKYALLDEIAATAFYAGYPVIGYEACMKLLQENNLPKSEVPRIQSNLESYRKVLGDLEKRHNQPIIPKPEINTATLKKKKFKERK
jgi:glycosyltransferase involved in cell wall biosynthesis